MTTWPEQTPVSLSRGNGDWAAVKKCGGCTLRDWFKWQVGTKREGAMTADEYAKAGKSAREADKVKAGWYSLSAYADEHRDAANWQGSNICILDADAKYGKVEGPQYSFTADALRERLDGLQFIALPTHSYSDEIPRWRIVIPVSEVITERKEFDAIARLLARRLDGYVDPRSYTPEQLWFSMSAPRGEFTNRVGLIVVGD
ncbi:MAG: hypothetical protein NTV11_18030 [Rhodocyclales bacterium]|nr:hypothetical protein [Rhodocyclales bacterium]